MTDPLKDIQDRLGYSLSREDDVWLVGEVERLRGELVAAKALSAKRLEEAFTRHEGCLVASESGCCGQRRLTVGNQRVLLRLITETLGLAPAPR